MSLNSQQAQVARLLYGVARSHGLNDERAREFVAASYAESGLNPHADNPSSHARGLFQLLSSGYRQKAQALGGLDNPRANALAILPDYLSFWKTHPNARPGEGGAAVERSGEGAGFYASPLSQLSGLGGGGGGGPAAPSVGAMRPVSQPAMAPAAPQVDVNPLRAQALQQLIATVGAKNPDYSGFLGGLGALRQAREQNAQAAPAAGAGAAPQLKVQVDHAGPVSPNAVAVVKTAEQYLGTAYKWGGSTPKTGFDCSGLLQWSLARHGVNIPRTTYDQWKTGRAVDKGALKPGDAVFFHMGAQGPGHVGIYVGHGQYIQAPHTGDVVKISKLSDATGYVGARRYA